MLGTPVWIWVGFSVLLVFLLGVDLALFHRRAHRVELKEALLETAAWIGAALAFNACIYFWYGPATAVEFLTGYLIEKALSVDNIFVILVIFQAFRIPAKLQHRVLYYGVLGALVMRGIFVAAGVKLLDAFHPVLYVFGAILLAAGIRMIFPQRRNSRMETNWAVKIAGKFLPSSEDFHDEKFLVRREGKWVATPLFLALVTVEAADIFFAVDSVPAVLAITRNAFIVFSSNAFAILGMRALYFALAGLLPKFRFLHQGLALLLIVVGVKMILNQWVEIPDMASLGIVAGVLGATVGASMIWPGKRGQAKAAE
ncbi:MAG TPA: TerC family protein [Verrucomicrobiae bacterium]|nr:TerC family protein [Verrucomicrobiae bacterium]